MSTKEFHVVDMFCGGGGESTGLFTAAEKLFSSYVGKEK